MRDRFAQFRCWLTRRHDWEVYGEIALMCRSCGRVRWIV